MIRARRIRTIASFELRATVLRISFLVTTFGLPLLLLAITGTSAFMQAELVQARMAASPSVGVVDLAHVIPELPPAGTVGADLVLYADERAGLRDLERRRIDALTVIAADWRTTGSIRLIRRADVSAIVDDESRSQSLLAEALRRSLASRLASDPSLVDRIVLPVATIERERLTPSGLSVESPAAVAEALAAVMVPMMLGILLMSALLMASGYLVQTIAQDKESKIVEVLLASATPDELLAGKLLGLGAAGLVQFAVWGGLGGSAGALLLSIARLEHVELPMLALATMPLFFLLGYAFLGSVMLATSAFGTSAAEAQKLSVGWVLLAIVPLIVLPALLEAPHGRLAHVLCHVPFSAPIAMVVRLAVDAPGVAAWEIALVVLELCVATYLAIRVGARFFRVGLLLTGGMPSPKALLAQLRAAR